MATAVANKEKSIMDHMAAAKSALATAEVHVQVLAGTFPDTFLAGALTDVMGIYEGTAMKSKNRQPGGLTGRVVRRVQASNPGSHYSKSEVPIGQISQI